MFKMLKNRVRVAGRVEDDAVKDYLGQLGGENIGSVLVEDVEESCGSLDEDNITMVETCYESVVDGLVLVKELVEEEIMLVALMWASELLAPGLVLAVDEGSFTFSDVDVSGAPVNVDDWNVDSDDPGSIEEPPGSSCVNVVLAPVIVGDWSVG